MRKQRYGTVRETARVAGPAHTWQGLPIERAAHHGKELRSPRQGGGLVILVRRKLTWTGGLCHSRNTLPRSQPHTFRTAALQSCRATLHCRPRHLWGSRPWRSHDVRPGSASRNKCQGALATSSDLGSVAACPQVCKNEIPDSPLGSPRPCRSGHAAALARTTPCRVENYCSLPEERKRCNIAATTLPDFSWFLRRLGR